MKKAEWDLLKDWLVLASAFPVLTAWTAEVFFLIPFSMVFCFAAFCMAACFVSLVVLKCSAADEERLTSFCVNVFRSIFMVDVLELSLFLHHLWSPLVILFLLYLSRYTAKDRITVFKNGLNNMMIMVVREEGDFQSKWVYRNPGSEIWCVCFDAGKHGMLIRRVTENEKGSEGLVTLEEGARTAKLFEWDGNTEIINIGVKKIITVGELEEDSKELDLEHRKKQPQYDVPLNATVLDDVQF